VKRFTAPKVLKEGGSQAGVRVELKKELGAGFAALSLTLLIAALAAATPLEDFLSHYPLPRLYPWYVYWRIAVVMLITWIAASSLASKERRLARWLMVTSALALASSHYAALAAEVTAGGVKIEMFPLLYRVEAKGGSVLKLDIGQVVLLITIAEMVLISRTRTASSGKPNPSR